MQTVLANYLTELALKRANPLSTDELSLRDALSDLLNQSAKELGKTVQFVGEAKVIAQGTRPDYIISRGDLPIGYIEAEKYGADLDNLKGHALKQNSAFIADLDNFLLTNHLVNRL